MLVEIDFSDDIDGFEKYTAWNLQKVEHMSSMFFGAESFNNGVNNSIEGENNVGNPLKFTFHPNKMVSLFNMFYYAGSFNAPIYDWDTSNIKETRRMFNGASKFNQEIRTWDVTGLSQEGFVTEMFNETTAFLTKYKPNFFEDYVINKNIIDTIKVLFEINSINLLL